MHPIAQYPELYKIWPTRTSRCVLPFTTVQPLLLQHWAPFHSPDSLCHLKLQPRECIYLSPNSITTFEVGRAEFYFSYFPNDETEGWWRDLPKVVQSLRMKACPHVQVFWAWGTLCSLMPLPILSIDTRLSFFQFLNLVIFPLTSGPEVLFPFLQPLYPLHFHITSFVFTVQVYVLLLLGWLLDFFPSHLSPLSMSSLKSTHII